MRIAPALATLLFTARLIAGPPFKTDDPEPVELGHLEFYVFTLGDHVPGSTTGFGPAAEFNYGILPDTQFHIIVPYSFNASEGAPTQGGLGDMELGIKYRFVHESPKVPQIGIFPFLEIPTGNADQGLGAGHAQIYLPVWAQKSWGPWMTYGGAGWWRNPGAGNRNWTYSGWLVQRDLGKHLTLGVEAVHNTATVLGGQSSTGLDGGGQVNITDHHHILFSVGRNIAGETQSYFYLAYQLTAGTFGSLSELIRRPH